MEMKRHPKVIAFLDKVCEPIKVKEMHNEIRLELTNHLQEIVEDRLDNQIELEQAIEQAIDQMGDPDKLGKQFHHVHRPKVEWRIIGLIGILLVIGLIAMYATELSGMPIYQPHLLITKSIYTILGIGLMVLCYYFDFRKLHTFSWFIYGFTLFTMLYSSIYGNQVNGQIWFVIGFTRINFTVISTFLFIISLAGIATMPKWKAYRCYTKVLILIVFPGIMYLLNHSYSNLLLYLAGAMLIAYITRSNKKEFLYLSGTVLGFGILMIICDRDYTFDRLSMYISHYTGMTDNNFISIQSIKAVQDAGLWGKGLNSVSINMPNIPNQAIFTYLIYCFGWVIGIVICAIILLFLYQTARMAMAIKNPYGKLIVAGILVIFAVQFIWSIFMSVGLLPYLDYEFPFISFGGIYFIFHLGLVGMMLSVYRKKNMIKSNA
ncbi:FtsW/RodA/SpoVE family cell cycle protein [Paenibacillus albiflavus]|uniref:FtsW/RodA/SpoVE family cell cycle protein n=1 Tax=Paenibacillus albiflavus TaxID=2545760 RepID=A0A4R4EIX3_9BACL|nr:FtsW/RodA/SpoVE family cell cycle protein [Paenibacillus albiflavus]TCZ80116.1 FtsW/RodA/SpoVE family cell cycle protein [Paenibacillus albiflavus]